MLLRWKEGLVKWNIPSLLAAEEENQPTLFLTSNTQNLKVWKSPLNPQRGDIKLSFTQPFIPTTG